jgi:hypothetical protein
MKRNGWGFVLVFAALAVLVSCNKKYSPGGPSGPVTDPNGPIIQSSVAGGSINGIDSTTQASVLLMNSSATPYPVATVSLSLPSGGTVVLDNPSLGYYHNADGTWSYQPGSQYAFNINLQGKNYHASVRAPGGVHIPPTSGSAITWSYEGNQDTVMIMQTSPSYSSTVLGPDAKSPINNPPYTASGTYDTQVNCMEMDPSAYSGAHPAAYISASDQVSNTVTKP